MHVIKVENCSQPILGQLLSFIPRDLVKKSVEEHSSDKWFKQVKTWDHFVFMFYAVLTGSSTIREVIKNFMLMGDKLVHCGIFKIPKRSTISDANAKRSSDVFGYIYSALYHYHKKYLSDSFLWKRINGEVSPDKVEIFDSSTVTLFKEIFKACGRMPKNGRRKGGLKAFAKITLSERVPNFICMKAASTNEKVFLSFLDLAKGTIAVFDKGFHKFAQYEQWTQNGVFYLTRMNNNGKFKVLEQKQIEDLAEVGVQMDAIIELEYKCPETKEIKFTKSRLVAYIDPASGKKFIYLTNLFDIKADTICLLYKNRWVIEVLFRQIKQNFELTYFLSDSEDGIKTQIWIAMILNLIFTVIHKMVKEAEDFSTMVKLARKNTASYISLIKFLQMTQQQISDAVANIGIVQYEIFPEIQGGGFQNTS